MTLRILTLNLNGIRSAACCSLDALQCVLSSKSSGTAMPYHQRHQRWVEWKIYGFLGELEKGYTE